MSQAATIYTDAELTNMRACAANLTQEAEALAAIHPFTALTEQEFYRGTFRACDIAAHLRNAAAWVASCIAAPESTNHLIIARREIDKAIARIDHIGGYAIIAVANYKRALRALGCQA